MIHRLHIHPKNSGAMW